MYSSHRLNGDTQGRMQASTLLLSHPLEYASAHQHPETWLDSSPDLKLIKLQI